MSLKIDSREYAKAARAIKQPPSGPMQDAVDTLAHGARERIQREGRRHKLSGYMLDHITVDIGGRGFDRDAYVRARGAANLINAGVRSHDIDGHAMPLRTGHEVIGFAEAVHHPGLKADPFVERAIRATINSIRSVGQKAADATAEGIVREIG